MTSADGETLRVLIHGLVQGVNYRRWLQKEAQARSILGWVRNRQDGSVEALLHGNSASLAELVRACHKGPLAARVDKVLAEPADCTAIEIAAFRIENTV